MNADAKEINKKFGSKIRDLFDKINEEPEWKKYVQPNTVKVVEAMYRLQSFIDAEKELNMKPTTIRSHLLRALQRINEKKTDYMRGGRGELSQELFDLLDVVPNWKDYVTEHEAKMVEVYCEVKNFYEVSRRLGLGDSNGGNIAGALYGTTRRIGVIGKLKQRIPQSDRRNID